MTLSIHAPSRAPRRATLAVLAVLLAGAATGAAAQYKIVGPDGHVTYTDKPPAPSATRAGGSNDGSPAASTGALPYEVRQAMSRYPVSLYAAKGCAPCDQARDWLKGRGIPFAEYSIDGNADALALQSKFGGTQVPMITIGGQVVRGFAPGDLQSYADAAGYPKQARLSGYRWPAPTPLAPPSVAAAATAAPAPAPSEPAPPPMPQPKTGIQF